MSNVRHSISPEMYWAIRRLAESRWQKLRPPVMEQLKKSGDKQVRAEVHLLEEEWDEAIQVAEGRGVWQKLSDCRRVA